MKISSYCEKSRRGVSCGLFSRFVSSDWALRTAKLGLIHNQYHSSKLISNESENANLDHLSAALPSQLCQRYEFWIAWNNLNFNYKNIQRFIMISKIIMSFCRRRREVELHSIRFGNEVGSEQGEQESDQDRAFGSCR